jgi:CubicO group peptidase (beta-lactamase class C family)
MVEVLTGERLDRFLRRRLFDPLGMRDTRFVPPRSWRPRIAPTEMDTTYRHAMVHGVVHDENAYAMGGVSGHAGLFGTAPDLARFAQMMLRAWPDRGTGARGTGGLGDGATGSRRPTQDVRLISDEIIQMFTQVQEPGFSSRALGWDTPSENSSAGTKLSPRAFGHTGFTGTSIWIDPTQDLFVILLTNRVHPTRDNTQIFAIRRAVADAAVDAAGRP